MSTIDVSTFVKPEGPQSFTVRLYGTEDTFTEVCPSVAGGCTRDHTDDAGRVTDIVDLYHVLGEVALDVPTADGPLLQAELAVDPYSTDEARRVPYVDVDLSGGGSCNALDSLNPEQLAGVIAKVRAHCDRLDELHAQLVQARAEWSRGGVA